MELIPACSFGQCCPQLVEPVQWLPLQKWEVPRCSRKMREMTKCLFPLSAKPVEEAVAPAIPSCPHWLWQPFVDDNLILFSSLVYTFPCGSSTLSGFGNLYLVQIISVILSAVWAMGTPKGDGGMVNSAGRGRTFACRLWYVDSTCSLILSPDTAIWCCTANWTGKFMQVKNRLMGKAVYFVPWFTRRQHKQLYRKQRPGLGVAWAGTAACQMYVDFHC